MSERNQDSKHAQQAPRNYRSSEEQHTWEEERTEEIQQYLEERYAGRDVAAQTRTASGQQLDWVPRESLTGGEPLADPPDEDPPPTSVEDGRRAEALPLELQRPDAVLGPEGTVPVVRKLIEEIRPGVALQDWLAKGTHARQYPPVDSPGAIEVPGASEHKYAYATQSVTCFGAEGNINVWQPWVEWSDEFSLGQLWLTRGNGSGLQTLEVGHQVYPDLYGDWQAHLFVFYTTNGYTSFGDNLGGYNLDVGGWVQYSNQIYPEAILSPVSSVDGAQLEMQLKVVLWEGNWWVRVNGIWMGYYPTTLYNSEGLQSEASRVDWGGEVVDSAHEGRTQTDMGSGFWPEDGWGRSAYMNGLYYQSAADGTMTPYAGAAVEPEPSCYGIIANFGDTGGWGPHFWWGGTGRNPACP